MSIDWISVEDSLPEPLEIEGATVFPFVLTYSSWHDPPYGIGYHDPESGWYDDVDYDVDGITHWAKLNEPVVTGRAVIADCLPTPVERSVTGLSTSPGVAGGQAGIF